MPRARTLLPVLASLAVLAGCSATHGPGPGAPTAVAREADAARLARVQRIGGELALGTASPERIDVGLSQRGAIGAWTWPDGRIRVSRALVDVLDDDELRAALAHEIGHLLDAGHVAGQTAALAGGAARHEHAGVEARADASACALLHARGAPTDALPRMLRVVADRIVPGDDAPDPAALRARADAAERRCEAGGDVR